MFYIGCPMWGYKEWVGNFFPAHTPSTDFLRLYSRRLTTVEGNTTFYATPSEETIARWREETPATFRFCPKISRDISHSLQLDAWKVETLSFAERMRGLKERLGIQFLQLPPTFSPAHLPQLATFLNFWPTELRLAVEVRHPAYFTEQPFTELNALLQQHNVARVIMDSRPIRIGSHEETQVLQARERKPNLPVKLNLTTDIAFVRYIGHSRMEVNEPFLNKWAQQLAQWIQQGITIYAFCHCPYEVHSPEICYALYRKVSALTPLPSLPSEPTGPGEAEQARLF
ncbi:MAG TPA: DUF72 domain-containing protein [Ktedonobacteraceae bacterium]|nr:DUF72 domain-containing protein [Ktedonobacteraceae bacterium]